MHVILDQRSCEFMPWRPEDGPVFSSTFALQIATTVNDMRIPWSTPCYVLGAATDGVHGVFLTRERVVAFLQAHATSETVFYDAVTALRVLRAVVGAREDIYSRVDKRQVWDAQLLHRLLTLATAGHTAREETQCTLAASVARYLSLNWPAAVLDSRQRSVRESYDRWLNLPPAEIEPIYLETLARDAWATHLVYRELQTRIDHVLKQQSTAQAFGFVSPAWLRVQVAKWGPLTHDIQLRSAIVLRELHAQGLHIDRHAVERLRGDLEKLRQEQLAVLRRLGYLPGAGSEQVLQRILERLQRRHPGLALPRTPSGQIATSEAALQELRGVEPFVDAWLAFVAVDRLLKTFLHKLSRTRVHPSYEPLLETGRTSSYGELNSQNLPRDERVRACFTPSPGNVFVVADYAMLELATLAQVIQSQFRRPSRLGRLLNQGRDLHRLIAARVAGKPESAVTEEERRRAKAINFGKPGGMGTRGLMELAHSSYGVELSAEQAQAFEAAWLQLFPEMQDFLSQSISPGLRLAQILRLTRQDFYERTQDKRYLRGDNEEFSAPSEMLGWMAFKSLAWREPRSRAGTRYPHRVVALIWEKFREFAAEFPADLRPAIRGRQPSPALARQVRDFLERKPVFTATGRLRADANYCQQRNSVFQGLAADGAKLALWRLWRAGFRVVNFVHDEFVVEIPEDCSQAFWAARVAYQMREAMREVAPDIAVAVNYFLARRWVKPPTPTWSELGQLIAAE